MGSFWIVVGIFGLVMFEVYSYLVRTNHKDLSFRYVSMFTFWKAKGFVGFVGFYLYYLIAVGLIEVIFNIVPKSLFDDLVEMAVIALPAIIVYVMLDRYKK